MEKPTEKIEGVKGAAKAVASAASPYVYAGLVRAAADTGTQRAKPLIVSAIPEEHREAATRFFDTAFGDGVLRAAFASVLFVKYLPAGKAAFLQDIRQELLVSAASKGFGALFDKLFDVAVQIAEAFGSGDEGQDALPGLR